MTSRADVGTEEEEEDRIWAMLTREEKRRLLALRDNLPEVESSPPSINDRFYADAWRLIVRFLTRDPTGFFALVQTCRGAYLALGNDFTRYAERDCLAFWVPRFLHLADVYHHRPEKALEVAPRRVFDEKARYILIDAGDSRICQIDKVTLQVRNMENTRANGYVDDLNAVDYLKGHTRGIPSFTSYAVMKDLCADYPKRKRAMEDEWRVSTTKLKDMTSMQKKRLFSDVWEEEGLRKKRFRGDDGSTK